MTLAWKNVLIFEFASSAGAIFVQRMEYYYIIVESQRRRDKMTAKRVIKRIMKIFGTVFLTGALAALIFVAVQASLVVGSGATL